MKFHTPNMNIIRILFTVCPSDAQPAIICNILQEVRHSFPLKATRCELSVLQANATTQLKILYKYKTWPTGTRYPNRISLSTTASLYALNKASQYIFLLDLARERTNPQQNHIYSPNAEEKPRPLPRSSFHPHAHPHRASPRPSVVSLSETGLPASPDLPSSLSVSEPTTSDATDSNLVLKPRGHAHCTFIQFRLEEILGLQIRNKSCSEKGRVEIEAAYDEPR